MFLGNGDGTFQQLPDCNAPATPSDLVVGDFNGDGIPDLAVSSSSNLNNTGSVAVMIGNGNGSFGAPVSRHRI